MDANQLLQSIVNQKLGAPPEAAAAPGGAPAGVDPAALAAAAQQQAPQAPPKASAEPTQQEKGAAKVAPKDAGAEASFEFIELDDDDAEGGKSQFTKQQLKGTIDRYKKLNHKWQTEVAPNAAILEVAKQIMGRAKAGGHEPKGDEVAEFLNAAVQAYISNPTMGGQKGAAPAGDGKAAKAPMGEPDEDDDTGMAKWEKDNAVSLPPGYKETRQSTKAMAAKIDQLMALVGQLAQAKDVGSQALGTAAQSQEGAAKATMSAHQQAAKNNVQMAMQAAQLKPEDMQDFQAFAMARGFAPPDFIDPELTQTVVQDFVANRQAPEISRLRDIASRRQAFTGSVEGAPGGATTPAGIPADPMFANLVNGAMGARNL